MGASQLQVQVTYVDMLYKPLRGDQVSPSLPAGTAGQRYTVSLANDAIKSLWGVRTEALDDRCRCRGIFKSFRVQ